MTETPQAQIHRLTMQRNEAREIYIRSAQVWASITNDLMASKVKQATEHAAENKRLRDALSTLVSMSDNHSPFGGEIYQDRVDRAWDNARAALKGGDA